MLIVAVPDKEGADVVSGRAEPVEEGTASVCDWGFVEEELFSADFAFSVRAEDLLPVSGSVELDCPLNTGTP